MDFRTDFRLDQRAIPFFYHAKSLRYTEIAEKNTVFIAKTAVAPHAGAWIEMQGKELYSLSIR